MKTKPKEKEEANFRVSDRTPIQHFNIKEIEDRIASYLEAQAKLHGVPKPAAR